MAMLAQNPQNQMFSLRENLSGYADLGATLAHVLQDTISEFWEMPISVRFLCVSPKNLYFWRLDDFYVSQLSLDESQEYMAQLRISDQLCAGLLDYVLGRSENDQPFKMGSITKFEAHLFNQFSKELFAAYSRALFQSLPNCHMSGGKADIVHLLWSIALPNESGGKLILTVPAALLQEKALSAQPPHETQTLRESILMDAHAPVTISIGSTRIPLADLRLLEVGDVVLLEQSRMNRMAIVEPDSDEKIFFTLKYTDIDKKELSTIEEQLAPEMMQELTMKQSQHTDEQSQASTKEKLWDNLMIDVHAEFSPVSLPLRQLKQMTEGLIVELGALSGNQIRLHVEGKTIADGELVIIGDQFGVRITGLTPENGEASGKGPVKASSKPPAKPPAKKGASKPSPKPAQTSEQPQASELHPVAKTPDASAGAVEPTQNTPQPDSGQTPPAQQAPPADASLDLLDDFDDLDDFLDDDFDDEENWS
ncbi:MAG: FliM/FliN family flagellar motor switch protein [Vampirovibrio sp.]|nr:FliM/FliN family flagellar motor switch protein [Vampirovibrio sp.]